MKRRAFLSTTALLGTCVAGCLGGDGERTDGYPAPDVVETVPDPRPFDPSSFDHFRVGGIAVPLVPIDIAINWYRRREARFVDARGPRSYDTSHITGAVSSPARSPRHWSDSRFDDPTNDWPREDRIVTYCTCPHHLSSLRAGEFTTNGYGAVFAIDEGYRAWKKRNYPVTGKQSRSVEYVIRGRTDPADADEFAWVTMNERARMEAAPIRADGHYVLYVHFGELDPETIMHLSTPSYEFRASLSELTSSLVTGPASD